MGTKTKNTISHLEFDFEFLHPYISARYFPCEICKSKFEKVFMKLLMYVLINKIRRELHKGFDFIFALAICLHF